MELPVYLHFGWCLEKSYDVLQIRTTQISIQYWFFLEISALYSDFISDSLNILVNNSYENIRQLLPDPMIFKYS